MPNPQNVVVAEEEAENVVDPEQAEEDGEEEESSRRQRLQEEAVSNEPEVVEAAPQTPPPAPVLRQDSSGGLLFQFNGVPITTLVDTVMRELGFSYVIDPQVQGTASIYTMGEIPRERALEVLEQLLQMNGQGIIRQDGMYVITPLGETTKIPHGLVVSPELAPQQAEPAESPAEGVQPEPVQPVVEGEGAVVDDQRGGVITYVIPLHHIPSTEMVTMVTPFVSGGANVINYVASNMLLITDYRSNIEQVLKLVELLDTQYFDINTLDLIPIRYNQAVDVAEDLARIFVPEPPAGVRIEPIERLNSILVVTRSASVFKEVQEWIGKLDAPSANTNIKTFVYQVENNTAMNIADVLSQLYQDGAGLPSATQRSSEEGQAQQQQRQPAPREAFVNPSQQIFGGARGGNLGPSLAGRPMSTQSGIRAVVSGNIKIIVNEFNNSLIIQATEADYQFLLETIKQLDVLPRQVFIEAKIYSVELRDDLSFGVAAFLEERGAGAGETGLLGPPTTGSITAPDGSSSGGALSLSTRAFIGGSRQLRLLINTLKTKTNVEILEAPRLLAMDGMQAQINVGAEVPVTTASFGDPIQSGVSTSFVNSIQFRPTGTTLLIMPRISASGIVTMDLAIEVSSATGTALTPTINRNFITTSLLVRDGQTVALAGIISDSYDISRSRVPILGDIPVVGALFGQTSRNKRRSELIFIITPHVIRNLPTATELTLDFKRALRSAYDFIERKESEEADLVRGRRDRELAPPAAEPSP